MKVYKSKSDIPYFKFVEFSRNIEDQPPEFIAFETKRIFNPDNLEAFSKALEISGLTRLRFKLDLDFKTAGKFIDADTYFAEKENIDFFKLVLKPRYFFKKINFDKITLAEAEYILSKFAELKNNLKAEYEYLYNPPLRAGSTTSTIGAIEREAFAEHYGPYSEMVYVLCKGDYTKFEEITSWGLHRFLFQAEYLVRKKDIENLK